MNASMTTVLLSLLLAATASSQITSTLPQCWQSCVTNGPGGLNCPESDLDNCLCSSLSADTAPLLSCVRISCSTTTHPSLVTDPLQSLQPACQQLGYTIPAAALSSASAAAQDAMLEQELKRRNVIAARTSMSVASTTTATTHTSSKSKSATTTTAVAAATSGSTDPDDNILMASYTPTDVMPSYYISTTDTSLPSSATHKAGASSGSDDGGTLLDMSGSGAASLRSGKSWLGLTAGLLLVCLVWM